MARHKWKIRQDQRGIGGLDEYKFDKAAVELRSKYGSSDISDKC